MKVVAEEAWMGDAACKGMDPELFHPHKGDVAGVRAAKAICAGCPVSAQCEDYATRFKQRHGIWGGTTEKDRRPGRVDRRHTTTPQRVRDVRLLGEAGHDRATIASMLGMTVRQVDQCRRAARQHGVCDCRPDAACPTCDCTPVALVAS